MPGACINLDLITCKQRGMLDDTLVIWGGEFGRTVYSQGQLTKQNHGRDHHPKAFTMWMAGAGVKPGFTYGETDDFSYNVILFNFIWAFQSFLTFDARNAYFIISPNAIYIIWCTIIASNISIGYLLENSKSIK